MCRPRTARNLNNPTKLSRNTSYTSQLPKDTITHSVRERLTEEMRMNFAIWENCDPAKRNRIPTLQFRHETKSMIKIVNEEIITEYLEDTNTLEQIQTIIYSAASTVISCNNQKIREPA